MAEKFKVGDYVTVVSDDTHPELESYKNGQVLKIIQIRNSDNAIMVRTLKDAYIYTESQMFNPSRFELFTGDINKLPKEKLYLCVKSSCKNIYGGVNTSIENAKKYVSDSSEHIIYELVPKIRITTQQVTEDIK
jgi:hypothetical protein